MCQRLDRDSRDQNLLSVLFSPSVCACAQLCLTLSNPADCTPPGSSNHGILQARILGWVAVPSSRGSSWPRDWTCISCIASGFCPAKPSGKLVSIWVSKHLLNKLLLFDLSMNCLPILSSLKPSFPTSSFSLAEDDGKVKEKSEKAGLKLNLQKLKIMEFGPITSCK